MTGERETRSKEVAMMGRRLTSLRVREMERRLSEGDALRDALQAKVDFLVSAGFELEKAHERRLSERESERDALQARVDALVSELEEAQDLVNPLTLTVNALQTKIDELHALACQVDSDAADAIKKRSNSASGSSPQSVRWSGRWSRQRNASRRIVN